MTDRLRCANCVGHVAYECDKVFETAVFGVLVAEAAECCPVPEMHIEECQEGERLKYTKHAPGTPYAVDQACQMRRFQNENSLNELRQELDCELTASAFTIALYEAVEDERRERPEVWENTKQGIAELFDDFLNKTDEEGA